MSNYLLDRYGLTGHDKVSLPGLMAVLRSSIPVEDIETLPFFEDMVSDLQSLPPPKRFSLFFPPRAVIEAAAKTYVQAAKDYYNAWCKSSGADFYDMQEPPASSVPVATLEGTLPWSPHLCYVERVSRQQSYSSVNKLQDGPPNMRATSSQSSTTRDGVSTPRKTRGLLPIRVETLPAVENPLDAWLMTKMAVTESRNYTYQDRFGYGPPTASGFFVDPDEGWRTSLEPVSNFDSTLSWGREETLQVAFVSAVLEVQPSALYKDILRLADYNASALEVEAGFGSAKVHMALTGSNTRLLLRPEYMPKYPVAPRLRVRQFMIDTNAGTQVATTTPAGTPAGSRDVHVVTSLRQPYTFPVAAVGAQWCPLEPAVTPEGNAVVQFSSPYVLLQGTARASESDETTHQVAPDGVPDSTLTSYLLNANNTISSTPYTFTSRLQLGLPGFRDIYLKVTNDYFIRVVRQGPEAAFVRAEKLDVRTEFFADAASVAELKAAADAVSGLGSLDPVSFATEDAAYFGMAPIVAWRTYHIEADVYAIFITPPAVSFQPVNNSGEPNVLVSGITLDRKRTILASSEPHVSNGRNLEAYTWVWVPCTALRGLGLAFDGPSDTWSYSHTTEQHQEGGPDEYVFGGVYTPLRDRNTISESDSKEFTQIYGHPRVNYKNFDTPVVWGAPQTFITRWLTETGDHVDLFGLLDLDAADRPARIYGTASPPWDDPTEQELRLEAAEPRQPSKSPGELPGDIVKAIGIIEDLDVRVYHSHAHGPSPQISAPNPLLFYAREVNVEGGDYDVWYQHAWDPVSAYASRYLELPDGYTWLKLGSGGVDVSATLRVMFTLGKYYPDKDITVGRMIGKAVGAGYVQRLGDISNRPGPYDLGLPYTYMSADLTTIGVSTPYTLQRVSSMYRPYMFAFPEHVPYPGDHVGTTDYTKNVEYYYEGESEDAPEPVNSTKWTIAVGGVLGLWDPKPFSLSATSNEHDFPEIIDPSEYDFMDPPGDTYVFADNSSRTVNPVNPYMSATQYAEISDFSVSYTVSGPGTATWPPWSGLYPTVIFPSDAVT